METFTFWRYAQFRKQQRSNRDANHYQRARARLYKERARSNAMGTQTSNGMEQEE